MAAIRYLGIALLVVLCSCGRTDPESVRFHDYYGQYRDSEQGQKAGAQEEILLSIAAEAMPLGEFVRWVVDETGVSIVTSQELDARTITVELSNQTVESVLSMVSRRIGAHLARVGNAYYLGDLRPEDRGSLVRLVPRLSRSDLQAALNTMKSDFGQLAVFPDGLVVISDRVEVLSRMESMLSAIEAAPAHTWVVQFYIVNLSRRHQVQFGLNVEHLASVAYGANSSSVGPSASSWQAASSLAAVLEASRTAGRGRIISEPLFLMLDGVPARLDQGSRVPIPRRTVSDQGTVTTVGFDFIDTGLVLDVELRETTKRDARMDLNLRMTQVTGFVEGAPIVSGVGLKVASYCRAGGVYLLGSLQQATAERSSSGPIIPTNFGASSSQENVFVWARLFRIDGPSE